MTSKAPDIGLDDELPWSDRLKEVEKSHNHIDPYTLWSLQTAFRQHLKRGSPELKLMDFLVELDRPYAEVAERWPSGFVVPTIYAQAMPGSKQTARHVTVRMSIPVSMSKLDDAIWALILRDDVHRAQIGFPRPAFPGETPPSDMVRGAPNQPWPPCSEVVPPPKVLIGVLEDACPFGHSALQGAFGTRVAALWDQSLTPASFEPAPAELGYGRVRLQEHLRALVQEHSGVNGIDEEALYSDPRALQPRLRSHGSHAAAVIGLLAGRPACLPSHPISADDPAAPDQRPHRRYDAAGDHAAEAPLAVVQFPREQIDIAGARWMVVRALDGLRYLASTSARMTLAGEAPLPLVANLSYGSIVGAHDGTGLLETAMAELAKAHRRMAIVLASGNSHGTERAVDKPDAQWPGVAPDVQQRLPGGRHAECASLLPLKSTTLKLYVPPNKPIETYLEIWFDDPTVNFNDEQFLSADEVAVDVTSPLGQRLRVDHLPGVAFDKPTPRHTCAGLLGLQRVAQSQRRSMVLLVVAATQISSQRVEVPSGTWSVRITNRGPRELRVHAWVERDLLPGGSRRSQAARLLPDAPGDTDAAKLLDDNTFNNIATGDEVFRVGALTWLGPSGQPAVSPYSSAAADDWRGPEFSAVADMSPALQGIRVSGNASASVARMNGTSVAAPQVARWLANQLAVGRTLPQIRRQIEGRKGGDRRRGKVSI
jgi:hypothetical protein